MLGERIHLFAAIDGYELTGPARQLLVTARDLLAFGVDTRLGVFERRSGANAITRFADSQGVPVDRLPDHFPGDPRTGVALHALLKQRASHVLQTHGYKANVLARLARPFLRRPWIAFLHGETWENSKVRAYFALEKIAVRAADRVVAVSRSMATKLVAAGIPSDKLAVVHNACLAPGMIEDTRNPADDGPPVIGVVARLSPEKGVDVALDVYARVARRFPKARLIVAGDGPSRVELRAQAERLGIGASVEWLGHREDLAPFYASLTVLLLPSRSEGLPNVGLEAMGFGIPVVATAVGGVPEIVLHDRTGLLAPSEDVQALADHVVSILESSELRRRLASGARDHLRNGFTREARATSLAAIYREVLS